MLGLKINLNEHEAALLDAALTHSGLRTRAEFIRSLIASYVRDNVEAAND